MKNAKGDFVEITCGCVGLVTEHGFLCMRDCDDDEDRMACYYRGDMVEWTIERRLSEEESAELIKEIGWMVGMGYRYKEIKTLLSFPTERSTDCAGMKGSRLQR